MHMAPGEIEWFKEGENPAVLGEARERIEGVLAADADLVAAVGPRLRREFADLLRGIGARTAVHEFVPGPDPAGPTVPPQLNHCLVLGRVDDYELKGLDIAARAVGLVVSSRRFAGTREKFISRCRTTRARAATKNWRPWCRRRLAMAVHCMLARMWWRSGLRWT